MKIVLLGYMGAGKSVVGRLLGDKLKLPFYDLDILISTSEGKTIAEIFRSSGEIRFRKKETEILSENLNSEEDFILALGGGTPSYGENLKLLQEKPEVRMVYLKSSLEELKKRLWKEKAERPLISHLQTEDLLEDFIRKHLFERSYYYNQSDMIISADGKSIEEIVGEIVEGLQ